MNEEEHWTLREDGELAGAQLLESWLAVAARL
jgi:hypothetical protein